ncbi:hypothetical protein M569_03478 [Genlisea aurea]|uniref:Pectinesterase inhibitor domain-containing protein n=1 Tax=Genlisea aurea TaxID=192259 RepID=S8E646_9LAMI|nr:hypothetical protein M569_03478 [Genlisea aurea]
MTKSPAIIVVLVLISGNAFLSVAGGLNEACKKTSDYDKCIQQIALNATLASAETASDFIARQRENLKNMGPEEVEALRICASAVRPAIGALRDAATMSAKLSSGSASGTGAVAVDVIRKLKDLVIGEKACCDSMKKTSVKVSDAEKDAVQSACKYVRQAAVAARATQALIKK